MMKEIKKHLKLIRYAKDFKTTLGVVIVFLIMGLFILLMDLESIVLASVDIFIIVTMIVQMEYSLLATGLCASSPQKRNLETWTADLSGLAGGILGYFVILAVAMIKLFCAFHAEEEMQQLCGRGFLFAGMMGGLVLVYGSVVYKNTLAGILIFIGGFNAILICSEMNEYPVSLTMGALSGFLFVLLGIITAGVMRRLLYRRSLTKAALGVDFQKQM